MLLIDEVHHFGISLANSNMADFAEESDHSAPLDDGEDEGVGKAEGLEEELADLDLKEAGGDSAGSTLAVQGPLIVVYCPVCSLPPEFWCAIFPLTFCPTLTSHGIVNLVLHLRNACRG